MGSGRANDEILKYTEKVIQDLEEYLKFLIKSGEPHDKRADKVDQWIESWTKYLKREKSFHPKSLPAFKRGSIIYVDLGFNIGYEYGGIHYAIVLNKTDSRKNHLLHILPLTSIKETTDLTNLKYYQLSLSDEIHKLLIQKAFNSVKIFNEQKVIVERNLIEVNEKAKKIQRFIKEKQEEKEVDTKILDYFSEELSRVTSEYLENEKLLEKITQQGKYIERLVDKIKKLKKGSIALLNQGTTISKLRILDPINNQSLLKDIVISTETLRIIEEALKKFI